MPREQFPSIQSSEPIPPTVQKLEHIDPEVAVKSQVALENAKGCLSIWNDMKEGKADPQVPRQELVEDYIDKFKFLIKKQWELGAVNEKVKQSVLKQAYSFLEQLKNSGNAD